MSFTATRTTPPSRTKVMTTSTVKEVMIFCVATVETTNCSGATATTSCKVKTAMTTSTGKTVMIECSEAMAKTSC